MAQVAGGERYAFIVDWVDPHSGVTWKYQMMYYLADATIEMYDIKNRRMFLKRCQYPTVKAEHLYLGSKITVYSRQLQIVDYADAYTQQLLETLNEKTLAMIKPDAIDRIGEVIAEVNAAGFIISKLRLAKLSLSEAKEFYSVHAGKPFYENLVSFMSSGPVCAMELVADGAIQKWRSLIGPTNTEKARAEAPSSLRARFGTDGTANALHGSDAPDTAAAEASFFFGSTPTKGFYASKKGCTCCVIKPHAVVEGKTGPILASIKQGGFSITGLELFNIDRANAMEFYEVYKGVVPEYNAMVEELTSGPFVAVEISAPGDDVVQSFRSLCGPPDPEIARVLRADSLRAKFGAGKVQNAVHCTDLPEDGELESQYFFDVLQAS